MKTQQGDRQPGWDPQQCCVQPLPPVLDGFSVEGTARHSGVCLCKCSCPREGTASAIARQTSPGVGITCFLEFLYDIFKRPWEICYMVMKKHKTIMSLPPLGGVDVAHTLLWVCIVVFLRFKYTDELASGAHLVWAYCGEFYWVKIGIYTKSIFLINPFWDWPVLGFNQHAKWHFRWPSKF